MSFKFVNKSGNWMLMSGLLAGCVFMLSQKAPMITTAQPPDGLDTAYYQADAPQQPMPEVNMLIGAETFDVEVAMTPEQLMRGLMFRTDLPEKHGMLFRFEAPRTVNFWMKNTKIPLDMIFIRRGQVVHVVHDAPPCVEAQCPQYSSVMPVDAVVELEAGSARRYGIDTGASVTVVSRKGAPAPRQDDTPEQKPPGSNVPAPSSSKETSARPANAGPDNL